jgi:hypothetical protein
LLVPSGIEVGTYDAPARFADALAAQLRLAGLFEVVAPEGLRCATTVDAILKGRFDEREMLSLAQTYHCDAVMFLRVNQFQAHWPLQASVTAALVDVNESVVIFAADGNWDTAVPEIKTAFSNFVYRRTTDAHFSARDIQLESPRNLFAFIAARLAAALPK